MKKIFSFIFVISFFLTSFSQSNFQFAFNPTDIPEMGEDVFGESIKLDPSGNIYIVGNFRETADFDFGTSVANLSSISNNTDAFISKYDSFGNFIYAKSIGGVGMDGANSIAIDGIGNIYVTGYFNNTVDFDPGAGVYNLTSAGSYDIFIAKYDSFGNFLYAINIGGVSSDNSASISVDASGNTYITGEFSGTADFDPGMSVFNLTSSGSQDVFVAKYNSSGSIIYAIQFGGISFESVYSLALDLSGNIHVTGNFSGTLDFDPSPSIASLTAIGSNAYVASYDGAGNYLSAFQIQGDSYGRSIATDATGIYFCGSYSGTADFDQSVGVANLTSLGGSDVYLAKYNFSGGYIYAKSIGGLDYDDVNSLAIDGSGNAYVTGTFKSVADFDPSGAVFNLNSMSTNPEIFYAKYDASGNYVYAKNTKGDINSGGGVNNAYSITVDNLGNAYITGTFFSLLDFDPSVGVKNICTVDLNNDAFISKYDNNGDYLWTGSIGGYGINTKLTSVSGIKRDSNGNIYVAGYFINRVDFDHSPGLAILTSYGTNDIFIAKYDSLGNYIYAKRIGGVGSDLIKSFVVDNVGNIFITGGFSYDVDFDPGIGLSVLSPAGGTFIAKYDSFGNYVYAKALGGAGYADPNSIVLDDYGNVYVSGRFNSTVDFDPNAGLANLTSTGSYDIFLAKYNSSGNYIYAKQMGGVSNDGCGSMAIDANSNIYIVGSFSNTVDFDPNGGVANLISAGSNDDGYFAKYDSSGNYLYVNKIGSVNGDACNSVGVDNDGNVVVAGSFRGTVDFDPGAGIANLTTTWYDFFLAKYDSLGNYIYAKNMDGTTGTVGNKTAIGFDSEGNTFLSGYFTSTIDFDGGAGIANLSSVGVSEDVFIAKYDTLGNYLDANKIGGVGNDRSISMVVNDSGTVWIAGSFMSTVDFDPNSGVTNLQCPTGIDMFVAVYNNASDVVWPGDSDNNNIVDNNDLLPIGLYYGQSGTPRATTSNVWQSYNSTDWGILHSSGADIKHADCNGDGTIDNNDTLAINLNFSLTHAFAPTNFEERLLAPDLHFVTSSSTYTSGSIVDVEVWAGTSTLPVSNLYGLAFTINYDAALVQPASESINYPASWLGTPGTDAIKIGKIDATAAKAYGAEIRIDHANASGFGKIADFKFQLKSSIPANTIMHFSTAGYQANDVSGVPILFNTPLDSIIINPTSVGVNEINNGTQISIYPNPTNGSFTIFTSEQIKNGSIEIYNSIGELIFSQKIINQQNLIDFKNQADGLYFVKVISDGRFVGIKKIVKE